MEIVWIGQGMDEKGIDAKTGRTLIEIDPKYFRPTEVDILLGDPTKASKNLGWQAETKMEALCKMMIEADMLEARKDELCRQKGFAVRNYYE